MSCLYIEVIVGFASTTATIVISIAVFELLAQ